MTTLERQGELPWLTPSPYVIRGSQHSFKKPISFVLCDAVTLEVIDVLAAVGEWSKDGWLYRILAPFEPPFGKAVVVFEARPDGDYTGASLLSIGTGGDGEPGE